MVRTKDIYFDTEKEYVATLDCEPETDFVEIYLDGDYITKVNIAEISIPLRKSLGITVTERKV